MELSNLAKVWCDEYSQKVFKNRDFLRGSKINPNGRLVRRPVRDYPVLMSYIRAKENMGAIPMVSCKQIYDTCNLCTANGDPVQLSIPTKLIGLVCSKTILAKGALAPNDNWARLFFTYSDSVCVAKIWWRSDISTLVVESWELSGNSFLSPGDKFWVIENKGAA